MKISFVYQTDAHFRAVYQTALRLQKHYLVDIVFYSLESDYKPCIDNIIIKSISKHEISLLGTYNYLICCLGGYLLNHVVREYKKTSIPIISLFPGIVSHYQLDAFISRMNVDQVWLNSKADYELYSDLCKVFNIENNGVMYGMPWIDLDLIAQAKQLKTNKAIFFEQTSLLDNERKKKKCSYLLNSLFRNNPDIDFLYKIRDNTENIYFTQLREKIQSYSNVEVVSSIDNQSLSQAEYFLTLSSSAIIEGLLLDKSCFLIQKDLLDKNAMEFFSKSKLFLKEKNYRLSQEIGQVDENWMHTRIGIPRLHISLPINKKKTTVVIKHRSPFFIYYYLLKLTILNRVSILKVLRNTQFLKDIQKSLEYISLDV